jgi:ribonuclease HII
VLDGKHDWLSTPSLDLFAAADALDDGAPEPAVRTLIKADMTCTSVAAASVLAKVERDAILVELAQRHPEYAWDQNKGYSAKAHMDALGLHGPTPQHRRSWNLPGTAASVG